MVGYELGTLVAAILSPKVSVGTVNLDVMSPTSFTYLQQKVSLIVL